MQKISISRIKFAKIEVDLFTIDSLTHYIVSKAKDGCRSIIGNHNQHSLYLFYKCDEFKTFYTLCDKTHIDGMSLVILGWLLGKTLKRENRITYVDLLKPLLKEMHENKLKLYYLGSTQKTIDIGFKKLQEHYPGIILQGHSGYFDINSSENDKIISEMNLFKPDILMVGMSMPRQELWIANNYHKLPNAVILPSGAALDYIAGTTPTPPRIAGKLGLEWLFRMIAEPRRLWRRYLIEPVFIVKCLIFNKKFK